MSKASLHRKQSKLNQVRSKIRKSKEFIALLTKGLPVRVYGGLLYQRGEDSCFERNDPDIDFVLHVVDYDNERYRSAVEEAAFQGNGSGIVCDSSRPTHSTEDERKLLKDILSISEKSGMPVTYFFDIHRRGFWKTIRSHVPVDNVRIFRLKLNKPRGEILERYSGKLWHDYGNVGVYLNYGFGLNGGARMLDIDNMVIARSIDDIILALRRIEKEENIELKFSRKLR